MKKETRFYLGDGHWATRWQMAAAILLGLTLIFGRAIFQAFFHFSPAPY